MKTKFSKAMELYVSGYNVIPVGLDKKPLINSWKEYQTKLATEVDIEKWWEMYPDANIGILTGEISNITVVDLDTKDGILRTPLETFPKTFTVRTGNGGYHLYYKYKKGLKNSAGAYPQYPGLDIRGEGGYVVGPHSVTNYIKDGHPSGGAYTIENSMSPTEFPSHLLPVKKERRLLSTKIGLTEGGRNESIASFIGQILQSSRDTEWESEVWPSVERVNATYDPPLSVRELRSVFDSIVKREIERRVSLIISPMQIDGGEDVAIRIRKNKAGSAYKDMANVLSVLSQHPYYKDNIRFNEFKQEIEYNGKSFEEGDLIKIQYFMQTDAELHGISKDAVYGAVVHYANINKYDEAKDWLASLVWDKKPRLASWIHLAAGVDDNDYHQGIGSQWFMGMIRRIMQPGCTFDHVLLLIGPQGIGKTSFFRILGGPWYKSYTGAIDNKDFYLALRGAMIVDLDEGAALYKSEAIKIKSVITETHDEFRAPYDRVMKKYPRRFVFSMSTNDTEPFRDATGNRRYWAIDAKNVVDFKWLENNREQLFAETYHYWKTKTEVALVPAEEALARQEMYLPEDSWEGLVVNFLRKSDAYCSGSEDYYTTVTDVYEGVFTEDSLSRIGTGQAMRITNILKKAGLEKNRQMIDGVRTYRWKLTEDKMAELREHNVTTTSNPLEDEFVSPL